MTNHKGLKKKQLYLCKYFMNYCKRSVKRTDGEWGPQVYGGGPPCYHEIIGPGSPNSRGPNLPGAPKISFTHLTFIGVDRSSNMFTSRCDVVVYSNLTGATYSMAIRSFVLLRSLLGIFLLSIVKRQLSGNDWE